jgi:hypothetical protein
MSALLGLWLAVPYPGAAPPVGATPGPAGALRVEGQAYEGPRGTIQGAFRGRCAPGLRVDALSVDFAQGDVVPPTASVAPIPCDGRWHRVEVSSAEAFEPGRATMTVRMRLVGRGGAPRDEVVRVRSIYVRPAGRIELPATVRLDHGALVLTLRARCDEPWLAEGFSVTVFQASAGVGASAPLSTPCDGVTRRFTVRLTSGEGAFRRGPVDVHAEMTLFDQVFFDPVAQPSADRVARVR